jgi:hypothetical protein
LPAAFGGCALLGGVIGTYDYVGGLTGSNTGPKKREDFFKRNTTTGSKSDLS